jgi:hypothetical protein
VGGQGSARQANGAESPHRAGQGERGTEVPQGVGGEGGKAVPKRLRGPVEEKNEPREKGNGETGG